MIEFERGLIWLAGICASITGVITFAKVVKKPYDDLDKRISDVEKAVESNVRKLDRDHDSFTSQEEVNHMILKSCSLLMKHCADNNHTGELAAAAKELDAYIYRKGGSL